MLGDYLIEYVPHLRTLALHHPFSGLNVLGFLPLHQPFHYERLEQLQSHLLRQTALVQPELRAYHDNRTTRIVNPLTQQVLTETTLLALEHIGQGLQRAVTRASHRTSAPTIIEQGIHRFLQHPLFVIHDDLGSTQIQQPF